MAGGRPPKQINWVEFEKLCRIQCSLQEMCSWFGVTEKTLERKVRDNYGEGFSQVFAKKRVGGLVSLRHNLFKLSEKNVAAAIFLSKNYLGMSDKGEIDITSGGKPIGYDIKIPNDIITEAAAIVRAADES